VLSRKWGFVLVGSRGKEEASGGPTTPNTLCGNSFQCQPYTGATRSAKRDRNANHDGRSTGDSERAREQGTGATSNMSEKQDTWM
jgi:hypothetical protein